MTKVHWTISYDSKRFFHHTVNASKNLKSYSMNIYYDWCQDSFGKSLIDSNINARWNPGFGSILYFKRKSDMILFLLTWQDIEI